MGLYIVKCPEESCGRKHRWFSGKDDQRCPTCRERSELRLAMRESRQARLRLNVPFDETKERVLGDGKWVITGVRRIDHDIWTGSLVDVVRDVHFLWTSIGGQTTYVRMPKEPTDIPLYIKRAIDETARDSK